MVYQSFPWAKGDSKSFEKLQALHLPDLTSKTVLDIGCNEGYFCGWAKFAGASAVTGVDKSQRHLDSAMALFPECTFKCQSWDDLDATKYDLIIFLSAIHYAADQEKTIHALMQRLEPDGILVLEIGIAPGSVNEFVHISRPAGGTYAYPTITKL